MTDLTPEQEAARKPNGQFGAQVHTAPELELSGVAVRPADTVYRVFANEELVYTGERGGGMSDALHHARVHANGRRDKPEILIRSSDSEGQSGRAEVRLPYGDQGRIVGWTNGDAITAEEMDERDISLSEFESVSVEPYIDLGPHGEVGLRGVEQWARDSDFHVSEVCATRDDDTGGRNLDVNMSENLLWDAESHFPDDDEQGRTPQERYAEWLTEHEAVLNEVYHEWFNAELYAAESWENTDVTMRVTVPYERFTESLVIEDIYPHLAQYVNRTDPGTFNSPYVMAEVWRRVEGS